MIKFTLFYLFGVDKVYALGVLLVHGGGFMKNSSYTITLVHCTTLEELKVDKEFKDFDAAYHYAKFLEKSQDINKWVITKIEMIY